MPHFMVVLIQYIILLNLSGIKKKKKKKSIFEECGAFKCYHFLYIFSRRQTDIYRFISKEIGFDISCKFHEIPKPIFKEK